MKIRVDTDYLDDCRQWLRSCSSEIDQAARQLGMGLPYFLAQYRCNIYQPSLKHCSVSGRNVSSILSSYRSALRVYGDVLSDLANCVGGISRNMDQAERELSHKAQELLSGEDAPVNNGGYPSGIAGIVDRISGVVEGIGDLIGPGYIDPMMFVNLPHPFDPKQWMEGWKEALLSGIVFENITKIAESIPSKSDVSKWIADKAVFDAKTGFSGEAAKYGFTNEYGGGNLVIGSYSGTADLHAGLLGVDKDGNLILDPKIAANVGLSYCALQADIKQDYELMPGLKTGFSGEVTAGKLDARAGLEVGLMKEGKFNPTAKLEANAQATLVDASARGYVDVAGIKGSVEGGVFVGAGAHFNAGIEDGVITIDMGAGLGIGANVEFSLDCSGLIDTVSDFAESTFEVIGEVSDFIDDMSGAVDCVKGAVDSILSWFS